MATTAAPVSLGHSCFYQSKMGKFSSLDPVMEQSMEEMSEQQLPKDLVHFRQILASIGFLNIDENVFSQLFSMFPVVESSALSKAELFLANLLKCDAFHHNCYFTAENDSTFRDHLVLSHSNQALYCHYCTKANHSENCVEESEHTVYNQADQLIKHIKEQHASLNYQCNLCFYRAFSAEHVFIHQAIEHLSNFEETLKHVILEKKEHGNLTPIEEHFLLQTNDNEAKSDDETEVENSDDESDTVSSNVKIPKNSVSELCKIICYGPTQPIELDTIIREYYTKHAIAPDSHLEKYSNSAKILCAYCQPETHLMVNEDFLAHAVSSHNAFPILAYDLATERSAKNKYDLSNLDNLDDDEAESIVSNFRQQLADNALPRSYDDSLMQAAFAYYSSLDNQASKGIKRKLDSGADGSSENQSITPKRRRFQVILGHLFSEPVLQRTRRVASVVGTAAMAVGFYHLTHYLPDSVQSYLN